MMGWSSKWIIVVTGPALEVEHFKRLYTEIFDWYPDGDCGAWQRVGLNLQLPSWTLKSVFDREEAEADAEERKLNNDVSPPAPPRPDEVVFFSPKNSSDIQSLKYQTARCIARTLIEKFSSDLLRSVEDLPEELQIEIVRWMTRAEFSSLKSKLPKISVPAAELDAQLIYDFSLCKGYQINELRKLSALFPGLSIDVAFWTQSDGEQQLEISGGGEMRYMIENPVEFDISYSHEFWIDVEKHVPPSKGWISFTKKDIRERYRIHFDTWSE
jgi:hypothetical protein